MKNVKCIPHFPSKERIRFEGGISYTIPELYDKRFGGPTEDGRWSWEPLRPMLILSQTLLFVICKEALLLLGHSDPNKWAFPDLGHGAQAYMLFVKPETLSSTVAVWSVNCEVNILFIYYYYFNMIFPHQVDFICQLGKESKEITHACWPTFYYFNFVGFKLAPFRLFEDTVI